MNIIIIGATSGIGKALFEKYATDGNRARLSLLALNLTLRSKSFPLF